MVLRVVEEGRAIQSDPLSSGCYLSAGSFGSDCSMAGAYLPRGNQIFFFSLSGIFVPVMNSDCRYTRPFAMAVWLIEIAFPSMQWSMLIRTAGLHAHIREEGGCPPVLLSVFTWEEYWVRSTLALPLRDDNT